MSILLVLSHKTQCNDTCSVPTVSQAKLQHAERDMVSHARRWQPQCCWLGLSSLPLWKKQGSQNSWRRLNNSYNFLKPFFALVMTLTAKAWGNYTTARENKPLETASDIPALPSPIYVSLLSIAQSWTQTAWKRRWTSLQRLFSLRKCFKSQIFSEGLQQMHCCHVTGLSTGSCWRAAGWRWLCGLGLQVR